ncbi:MAG: polysaccharide pyruvyl transferase [Sphingomonadales bacterium]|nr:polysaccharide pyruvyl transferase [Sphingomonadales bacterium]
MRSVGPVAARGRPYKVAVLTFHKCINYGSYWQARCLVEGLRGMGADVVLLDHESASIRREEWRCALRPTLPEPTIRSDFPAYAEKTRKFLTAFEKLPRSSPFPLEQPDQLAAYDAIVIGSDEVWNLHHPWYGGYSIFYGAGLPCKNIVSYAASFGSQDAAEGLAGHWADQFNNFAALSVRDENSRRIVKAAVGHDPELVLDPCLQFPPALADDGGWEEGEPYIALYGHGFPTWFSEAVRQEADRNGQRIISIGYRNHWADEQRLTAGPEEFAQLIARSSAVVTNFFHGCVFALVNGLPLVTAPSAYRLNKVRDLLHSLDAERHMVTEYSSGQVYQRLLVEPPETVVAERIASLRRGSDDYLRRSLAFQR